MPLELVVDIFEIYIREYCGSPLALGAICRTWRHIAWSTSRLWTLVTIWLPRRTITESMIQVIAEWLTRSHQLPLDVRIHGSRTDVHVGPAQYLRLAAVINQSCNRWRSFSLDLPISTLRHFNDVWNFSPTLTELQLFANAADWLKPVEIKFQVGMPQTVCLTGIPVRHLDLRWDNVTTVHVNYLTVGEIIQILELGPLIQQASFDWVDDREVYYPPIVPTIHPSLRDLKIDFNEAWDDIGDGQLFDAMTFPALQKLVYSVVEATFPEQSFASCLQRSSCQLEELSILGCTFSDAGITEICKLVPTLTKLELSNSMMQMPLQTFYKALEAHLTSRAVSVPLLPRLEVFQWEAGPEFAWESLLSFLVPLDRDSSRRRPLKLIEVRCDRDLENEDHMIPYIDQGTWNKLRKLGSSVDFDLRVKVSISSRGGFYDNLISMSSAYFENNNEQNDI
ncbi:hypothetical protein CVT26_007819 [Gymnopilus dilepis]|uniref:F-box domain-containing protein n=1 Tax=Gymnopilus dilepis TaxID=231916 RepID=A0A409W7T7_9AGAR|nr:hypothetical protein CVT26_007819 [Gymnopilus dilepis]